MSEKIKEDFLVKVHYTGKLEDGNVFDSSEGREPLEFITGTKLIIKGFDDAVMGMEVGEEKDFNIKPEDAYGVHNPDLIQTVPKASLGDKADQVKVGMVLGFQIPGTEHTMQLTVTKIEDETLELDANPPLAGKNLNFHIKVVEARKATEEDKKKFLPPSAPDKQDEEDDGEECSGNCASCNHQH